MKSNHHSSLVIVGLGIKLISHITHEAKIYIEQSSKVLYLVNEPTMKDWIKKINPNAESLDELYRKFTLRKDCYKTISNYILETLRSMHHVCVILYGHPSVFSQPALDAVIQAKKEGYYAKILPAISAEDCLFADLLIDPASSGCHSFEATDFLIHKRKFDPHSHLILWQISCLGMVDHSEKPQTNSINLLLSYLEQYYTLDHEVVLYEASQYPHVDPHIIHARLRFLSEIELSPISTLYIPPTGKSTYDASMLNRLNIKKTDLL